MTDTNKYACEYFYYLLEKEESDFTMKVSLKNSMHIPGIWKPNTIYILYFVVFCYQIEITEMIVHRDWPPKFETDK